MSRRSLLILSIILSLAFHAAMLALAPRIRLLEWRLQPHETLERFDVQLLDAMYDGDSQEADMGVELATRPGRIEDLLTPEHEVIAPKTPFAASVGAIPDLAQRLAANTLRPETPPAPPPNLADTLDTRIVEITSLEAREAIQVARRFVAPSPDRILDEDIEPAMRGEIASGREDMLAIDPLRVVAASSVLGSTGGGGMPSGGEGGGSVVGPGGMDPLASGFTQLAGDAEMRVASAAVTETIQNETGDIAFLDDLVDISLAVYLPGGDEQGYFRLRITPKPEAGAILPKDVIFLIDSSQSITARKLSLTAKGVTAALDTLNDGDRFNIFAFRDNPSSFRDDFAEATNGEKTAARLFLASLESRGETNIYGGVKPVLSIPFRPEAAGIVFLASDGRPTTGVRDARMLINSLTDSNDGRKTILTFGGGKTVNRYLLELLALRNRGMAHVAPDFESIPRQLPDFAKRIRRPILIRCEADYGRLELDTLTPRELPDLFMERPIEVYGRFDANSANPFAMRLTGSAATGRKELLFVRAFSEAEKAGPELTRDWASHHVYDLIGEMCRLGETSERLTAIRQLGKQYKVKTSYD